MLHWNYLLSLERDILRISNYIEFIQDNYNTYSIELLKLNLAIGSEFDVVMKVLGNEYCPEKDFKGIADYKVFLNEKLPDLISQSISITRYNIIIKPLEEIGNKNGVKFQDPFWWDNYNNVKHHRNSAFANANLKNLIFSFGALALINLARIIKIQGITDTHDLYKYVDSPVLYDFGEEYCMYVLGV